MTHKDVPEDRVYLHVTAEQEDNSLLCYAVSCRSGESIWAILIATKAGAAALKRAGQVIGGAIMLLPPERERLSKREIVAAAIKFGTGHGYIAEPVVECISVSPDAIRWLQGEPHPPSAEDAPE